jgi:hypothetical protein
VEFSRRSCPNVNPSYNPAAPFISTFHGEVLGDVWLGAKLRLTPPKSAFGLRADPGSSRFRSLATSSPGSRMAGAPARWDYGMIAAFDGRLNKYVNLSSNVGFIRRG